MKRIFSAYPVRTLGLAAVVVVAALSGQGSAAGGQNPLPKELLSLLPNNAVDPAGAWTNAGPVGILDLSARLTSTAPCVVDKAPGRIGINCRVYFDVKLVNPMQAAAMDQRFAQTVKQLEDRLEGERTQSRLLRAGAVSTEDVPGGRIAGYDFVMDCSEFTHREMPLARLRGLIKTDKVFGTLEVEGPMTFGEARTLAVEALGKLLKVDFSQVGKGPGA